MVLALENDWIWDTWYYRDDDIWHCYFLKAPKSLPDPEMRHFNVTQGHATSTDLINWTHLGTTFAPAPSPAWDDSTTWTGSVIREAGVWHLFYTGTRQSENSLYQRIGHATSTNGHNWTRVGDGLCLDIEGENAKYYEVEHAVGHWHDRAMRDPWVMRNPEGEGWIMLFTARAPNIAEPNAGGAIGFATSDDLNNWTLQPPLFVGGYGQLEVPQLFNVGDEWYCLFCTAAEHFSVERAAAIPGGPVTGSHYLRAPSPMGPWRVAEGHFLDGALPSERYAARILATDNGLKIIGFVDRPNGQFVGHVTDPDPVTVCDNGNLHVIRNGN